jgi:hypothetical protein
VNGRIILRDDIITRDYPLLMTPSPVLSRISGHVNYFISRPLNVVPRTCLEIMCTMQCTLSVSLNFKVSTSITRHMNMGVQATFLYKMYSKLRSSPKRSRLESARLSQLFAPICVYPAEIYLSKRLTVSEKSSTLSNLPHHKHPNLSQPYMTKSNIP